MSYSRVHEHSRSVLALGEDRAGHRGQQRPRRGVRGGAGRGRGRRGAGGPAAGQAGGRLPRDRAARPGRARRADRRHRPGAVPGGGAGGGRALRPPGCARQQRRPRHRRPRAARDPGAVPRGHRRQPDGRLLDGPGGGAGHAARLEHRQHRQPARPGEVLLAAGGLRGQQGGPDRADPRPEPAVVRAPRDPGQRGGARVLPQRDDGAAPAGQAGRSSSRARQPSGAWASSTSSIPWWCSWPAPPRPTSPASRWPSTAACPGTEHRWPAVTG